MSIGVSALARVQTLWTAFFTLALLLNLDQFGVASGLGPAPKYWSVGIFVITFGLFLVGLKPGRLLKRPLFWWALGYLVMSGLWVGLADNLESAGNGLILVVTTGFYVGTALLAYPHMDQSGLWWGGVLWIALLLAVFSIMQEYFNPAAYVFASAGQGIVGRAAGLYLNPNIAAQTIVMILACMMLRNSRLLNLVAASIALVGLFLTFSRGGLIAWLVLMVAATVHRRLPRWFVVVIAGGAAITVLAGPRLLDALSIWVSPDNRNSLDRLAWLLGQGRLDDSSAGARDYIFSYGWQQYLEAPILGHGLGYMWVWPADAGTHNLMLRHLVEYGALGVLIFPLFLLSSIRSAGQQVDRYWLWLVAGMILLLSMLSHNMLEQPGFLLPWLAMCLMSSSMERKTGLRTRHG